MKPECALPATTFINIVDKQPQEQMKSDRRTLQDLQLCAGIDKENLVGGGRTLLQKESLKPDKETIGENSVFNKPKVPHKRLVVISNKKQKKAARGKDKAKVTVEDLTSNDSPSEDYWCVLAEKRRLALEEALEENMKLHEKIALLEEENSAQKIILQETNGVLNVLREMVGDVDDCVMSDVSNAAEDNFLNAATEDSDED